MAEFRVTGPDGAKYKVTAPDEAAAAAAVSTMFGAPASGGQGFAGAQQAQPAAAPAPEPRSWAQAIGQTGAQAMIGVRRGVSALAGLPVDAVNNLPRALNLLPGVSGVPRMSGSRPPVGGSDFIDAILASPVRATQAALGQEQKDPEPVDIYGRVARRAGEEVGGAVLPAGAVLRTAKVGAELSPLAKLFGADKARVDPTRYVRDEAAAATAAGLGAAGAGELAAQAGAAPHGAAQNTAELGGSLAGVGALSVGRGLAGAAGNVLGAVTGSPRFADRVVRQDAADAIINSSTTLPRGNGPVDTSGMASTLSRPDAEIAAAIPGFRPSTADRLGDAGVAALEYNRASQAPGTFNQRRSENAAAVDTAFAGLAPDESAAVAREAMIAERDARRAAVDERAASAAADAQAAQQGVQPTMTADVRGADLRAALQDAFDRVRAAVRGLYDPIDSSSASVNMRPLADAVDNLVGSLSIAERERFVPREANIPRRLAPEGEVNTGLLDSAGDPITRPAPSQAPLNEATGLRSAATDASREAGSAGRLNEARVIDNIVRTIDDFLANAGLPPALRAQLDTARAAARDLKDRFTRPDTQIAQTLAEREGVYRVPDSGVAGRFVATNEGRLGDYQALLREAGNDPRAIGALQDQLLAEAQRRGALNSPEQAQQFLGQYGQFLDQLPGGGALRDRLAQAAEAGATARLSAQNQEQFVRSMGGVLPSGAEARGTSTVAKWINYGEENAARAMQHVANQQDPARAVDDLMRFVGNDTGAVQGLRRAFWDLMEGRAKTQTVLNPSGGGTTQAWSPVNLRKFLENPGVRAVAERLYRDNPEHLQNLDTLASVLQRVDTRTTARAPNTSGTAQASIPVETVQSSVFAAQRGVVGWEYAATRVFAVWARRATSAMEKRAFEQVLDRALVDPEYAATLLRENNPANRAALAKATRAWMGPAASDLVEALDASVDPDAEMKRAITKEK